MASIEELKQWVLFGETLEFENDITVDNKTIILWIKEQLPKTTSANRKITPAGRLKASKLLNNALLPNIGLSLLDDESETSFSVMNHRLKWLILRTIDQLSSSISQELWWITPTILAFLDHSKIFVKLLGVEMLSHFLDLVPQQIFVNAGLFSVYYEALKNLCFYLPPAVDQASVLKIMQQVYPCMLALISNSVDPETYCLEFFSDIILRTTVPRIYDLRPQLPVYVLQFLKSEYLIKRKDQVFINVQRLVYVIGQYFVQNPFLTTDIGLLQETQDFVKIMIQLDPQYKYDYLAMIILMWGKCMKEGKADQHEALHELYLELLKKASFTQEEKTALVGSRHDIDLNDLLTA
ncbi:hypothetical protein ACO0QE_001769 [Hanseniaspora vineae]